MAVALLTGLSGVGPGASVRPQSAAPADATLAGQSLADGTVPEPVAPRAVTVDVAATARRGVGPAGPVGADGAANLPGLPRGRWPLPGEPTVVREYAPPTQRWLAGHRGLDLAAAPGAPVLAAAAGVVSFAGTVAGKPVVSVRHGAVRTTYEPVVADVVPGQGVQRGTMLGRVALSSHCPGQSACLHWGLRLGDAYLDPRLLLGGTVRLFPLSEDLSRGPATTGRVTWLGPG